MKLVLVKTPTLETMTPAGNELIAVSGVSSVDKVTATTTKNAAVDGFEACSMVVINAQVPSGSSTVPTVITLKGSSVYCSCDGEAFILVGDQAAGTNGGAAVVISAGQTSTFVE